MGFLSKLFSKQELKSTDIDLGAIKSFNSKGNKVTWLANRLFLNFPIEIFISGNKNGVSKLQKEILLEALNNEKEIKLESVKALKNQYEDAVMNFTTIEELFDIIEITVNNDGFTLTFQEIQGQNHFFNVHFENNIHTSVTIEGY